MKLNSALVERTLNEFDAQAIPDDHPVVPQLCDVFGEHTFFINGNGLHVVEPETDSEPADESASGKVVKLAGWTDENRNSLSPHPPEPTGVVIPFVAKGADPAA